MWCGEEVLAMPREGYALTEVASWVGTSGPWRMK